MEEKTRNLGDMEGIVLHQEVCIWMFILGSSHLTLSQGEELILYQKAYEMNA